MCALWIDRHRPHQMEELTIQQPANELLLNISGSKDFPHLLVCGPPGSGKKTRVLSFIRRVTGCEISHPSVKTVVIEEDGKQIEIQVTSSNSHLEITPADAGNNDRRVITSFLKDTAASATAASGYKTAAGEEKLPFKIVVVNEAHRLSRLAQQALRRTMEKYVKTCKLILIADSLSQIIEPVRSRCLVVRTPRVPHDDIMGVISEVAEKESFKVDEELLEEITNESNGNLRRAINILEMVSLQKKGGSVAKVIPEWERYTDELSEILLTEQLTQETIKDIRVHLYELIVHCVPPTEIIRRILKYVFARGIDAVLIDRITTAAATYEARMQLGSKPIFHLEAFCARFICIYREFLTSIE